MARKSTYFLLVLALGAGGLAIMCAHSFVQGEASQSAKESRETVKTLGLTDLCLFTEARYMRHLSQADLHSAFQDFPAALEHFPSGSFGGYRIARVRQNAAVD